MKSQVSPIAVAAVIVSVLVIAVFAWTRMAGKGGSSREKPPGMPASAAAEFQKRLGTPTPTGADTGPTGANTGSPQAPGYPTPNGYIAPPTAGGR